MDSIRRPFLSNVVRESSQAHESQFDPLTGRLHGAAPHKDLFKNPVNVMRLNQNVKKMLDFGWKFDTIRCSAVSALNHPNSTDALTKEEFHWIKGLKLPRESEEAFVTQAEEARAKEYITREMSKTPNDDDEFMDDATFKKLLDEFYDDSIGTGPSNTIEGHNDNDVSLSRDCLKLSANPPPSDQVTKKSPTAPTFPIEEVSQEDKLFMQYLYSDVYSDFTGTEECDLNLPYDCEDLAALKLSGSYQKEELPVTLGTKDAYDKKLHNAIEHQTVTMREIMGNNPDYCNPTEYWPNMSRQTSHSRQGPRSPLVRGGQPSTNSPDRSAAVENQLLTDLQASAKPSALERSSFSCSPSRPQSEKSGSSSDIIVSSTPIRINPNLPRGGNVIPTRTHVNLLPEYNSDSETEDSHNSREVTPTPSGNRAASRLGRRISKTPAHVRTAPVTNRRMTTLECPPPIVRPSPIVRPCTPVQVNSFRQLHAEAFTPTRPLMSILTPGSTSPIPQRRLPKSSFRGHILTTPTKQRLLPTSPCPWLVPANTGPQPPVAHMYPGQCSTVADMFPEQYRWMAATNIKRTATSKKATTKGKNNAGKQKRSAAGEQSTQAGPAPKKRRTKKSAAVGVAPM